MNGRQGKGSTGSVKSEWMEAHIMQLRRISCLSHDQHRICLPKMKCYSEHRISVSVRTEEHHFTLIVVISSVKWM